MGGGGHSGVIRSVLLRLTLLALLSGRFAFWVERGWVIGCDTHPDPRCHCLEAPVGNAIPSLSRFLSICYFFRRKCGGGETDQTFTGLGSKPILVPIACGTWINMLFY